MLKKWISNYFGRLKLNKKFLIIYIFCVILPLIITDAFLFRSVVRTEMTNQEHYRESAIETYSNYLADLLSYDANMASAIDLNKSLNTFINTPYKDSYDYYYQYMMMFSNSFFTTLSDLNWDRVVIYTDNKTMMNGNYFHPLSEAEKEVWYQGFIERGEDEGIFVYYDHDPVMKTFDQHRFIYVRRMTSTKSIIDKIVTIEHKHSRITKDLYNLSVNCSMYLCSGDYVIYSNDNAGIGYQDLVEKANRNPYATVREFKMYGNTFTVYAFTEKLSITSVIKNNIPIILIMIFFTLLLPVVILRVLERSITERIKTLEKAFGEGDNDILQPIKEITGSDEISSLMHNYNRIVDINKELTQTIYKDKLREQESDIARKNAELLALQSQINPHFLFNALESIRMHSILKGETETAEMVQRLAVMQRQNVEWHEDSVTIEEEEEFIDAYLQLQSYRFGDRISFNIDIKEDCSNVLIPKLTLVTFVENACIHGIESKSSQGWIFVRVYKNDGQLMIEVEDTGDGMDEEEVSLLQERMNNVTIDTIKKAKHVGILNACLRIKMMFNNQARFSIESEKGIGTSVIIMIPEDLITTA